MMTERCRAAFQRLTEAAFVFTPERREYEGEDEGEYEGEDANGELVTPPTEAQAEELGHALHDAWKFLPTPMTSAQRESARQWAAAHPEEVREMQQWRRKHPSLVEAYPGEDLPDGR